MNPETKPVTVALVAIPNTGKTTFFNRLTGSSQTTGNWPEVSIEQKIGSFILGEYTVSLIDLPGAYALSPASEEEQVVHDYFLRSPPDIILNILDARNLYRGLGLTLQLTPSGLPMVVAVNMMDEARRQGISPDFKVLAQHLSTPVIGLSARTSEGLPALEDALYGVIKHPEKTRIAHVSCPPILEKAFAQLTEAINQSGIDTRLDHTFLAMRLLEEDDQQQWTDNDKLAALIFRIGGNLEPFIMEIPPYRLPTLRSISLRTWYELKDFLSRAATLIVAGVLIVWLLIHMPADVPPGSAATWAGQLGQMLAPVFQPLGIDWQETIALIFGFIAKEIVIGGLAVIYGGTDLAAQMSGKITPLQSISFMVVCLLYSPCVATIAAIWPESRSIKITLLSLVSGLGIAWITSFVFYQTGLLLGFH